MTVLGIPWKVDGPFNQHDCHRLHVTTMQHSITVLSAAKCCYTTSHGYHGSGAAEEGSQVRLPWYFSSEHQMQLEQE